MMKEREGEDILGEHGTDELVMKDDKLVLNLIFDEGMNEDIAVLDESDWNDLVVDTAKQLDYWSINQFYRSMCICWR